MTHVTHEWLEYTLFCSLSVGSQLLAFKIYLTQSAITAPKGHLNFNWILKMNDKLNLHI